MIFNTFNVIIRVICYDTIVINFLAHGAKKQCVGKKFAKECMGEGLDGDEWPQVHCTMSKGCLMPMLQDGIGVWLRDCFGPTLICIVVSTQPTDNLYQ